MKDLSEYINEAINPQTGIGAFDWGESGNLPHNVIDILVQRLPGLGFKPTEGNVQNMEYKLSHNGYCLCIGVKAKDEGEGTRTPNTRIFVRQCNCGKLSIVEKFLNIEGDGKATFKTLEVKDDKFIWTPCDYNKLPRCGNIENSAEFAEELIKKIVIRSKRYTK